MVGGVILRIGFRTTIEENLVKQLKIDAINKQVNVNDILEELIKKYLDGEIKINFNSK